MSRFSGLNNLKDITVDARYSALCGYTEADLDQVFAPEALLWQTGYLTFTGSRQITHGDEDRPAAWTLAGLVILRKKGWTMGNNALRADHCA